MTSADITQYRTINRSGFGGRKTKGKKKPAGSNFGLTTPRRRLLHSLRALAAHHLDVDQTPSVQGQAIAAIIAELRIRHPAAFMSLDSDADDVKSKDQVYRDQIMDYWRKHRHRLRKSAQEAAAAAAAAAAVVNAAVNVAPANVASASNVGEAAASSEPRRSTRNSPAKKKKK